MSKKTNAEKQKRKPKRHYRRPRSSPRRHPNPAFGMGLLDSGGEGVAPFGDSIFLHHVVCALARVFQLGGTGPDDSPAEEEPHCEPV